MLNPNLRQVGALNFLNVIMKAKQMNIKSKKLSYRFLVLLGLVVVCVTACADLKPHKRNIHPEDVTLKTEKKMRDKEFATSVQVEAFSATVEENKYIIGPGDVLSLKVWNRPNVSDPEIIVGPDGIITVPRIGFINAIGRTREEIALEIKEKLCRFYSYPEVILAIEAYNNNKAFVLGRVEHPGVVIFHGKGTLLEALSIAGGYSTEAEDTYLTKCSIIRGKDTIIWIDLNELLRNGNISLNARIKNNDVIFIPESESELVYVMGEVASPGAYRIPGQLSLMDALMRAGGPTDDANRRKIFLIRATDNGQGIVKEIDLLAMLEAADFTNNYLMQDNDVIYVAEKGISKFNYVLEQIMPSLEVLNLGTDVLESFGVMQEMRESVWGQEGTVGK